MGNFCGGLWCGGSDDDENASNEDLMRQYKGPSSDSLLRTVKNPDVGSLIEIEHEAKQNFHDKFILGRKLGSGSFATVYECGEIATQKTYACKGFYKEDNMYILVMEELRGGDVFDKLREMKDDIHERDVCRLVKMFLEALTYIHARNIVHRDLKNLMLDSPSPTSSTLKIVDFGFAIQLPHKEATLTEVLGTPGYMAPEVIQGGPYGKPADVWSAGVIVYTLLCGYPPFHHDRIKNIQTLFRSICCGFYFFDSVYWSDISLEAKVRREASQVATAAELLQHEWFARQQPPLPVSPRGATANTLKAIGPLRSFNRILKARVAEQHRHDSAHDDTQLRQLAEDKIQALEKRPEFPPPVDLSKSKLLPATRYNVQ
ncbi:hypothetical protein DYB32_003192 [Aphanomyces invadans]|uniref:Protein kinase domain-containing protein n=1 Tax=Aphanomyces invadans TaxID=157072 RepID=A0A3R6Z1I4_9STRA|nr:hypothetical protein DYB32_003192 [Aphanomyces invadans]